METVAIVILNWNGRKMLERYLPALVRNTLQQAQIIVADNASTDDSMAFLAAHYPDIRCIELYQNLGFAEGYNRALQQVESEYYVLLNSDVEVTENWLQPLLDYMEHHPDVAACQPKLHAVTQPTQFEYAGAAGGFMDRWGYPFCRGRMFETVETDHGQYDRPAHTFWATGACLFIRATDYWAAGGLDQRFFAHSEEIDLCWRLNIQGRKIACVPGSTVYHVGGGTLPKGNARKTYLNFRNNLTMLYKNLPSDQLRPVMAMRWLLDYVAAWQTLITQGNVANFKAIYKARHDFWAWRNEFKDDRRRIQSWRSEKSCDKLYRHAILWQYYIRHRRTFASLPQHNES